MATQKADGDPLVDARIRGEKAGDDDRPASDNPYLYDTHAAQHAAWEEARQEGKRNH